MISWSSIVLTPYESRVDGGGDFSIVLPLITGGLLDDFFGLPFLGKDLFT
jgi:hypothetical protein